MKKLFGFVGIFLLIFLISSCRKDNDNSIKDGDGNVYTSIKIGTQEWLSRNLETTRYLNGDLIGTTHPISEDISGESTPKYQWSYEGLVSNVVEYGRLYTWYAANDSRKVCPSGWHVPDITEWTNLITYLGGESNAGEKLMETGTAHWPTPNSNATNGSGFTAIPGGYRETDGNFYGMGSRGFYWASTVSAPIRGYYFWLTYDGSVGIYFVESYCGHSVRCIKD
jgi:uncharacterized protein (TIGR02145 family)